jgi:hypothetical protein
MVRTAIAAVALVPCVILLLPAFGFAALAVGFASSVRALGRLLESSFTPWGELIAFDRRLGWKARPNLDVHYLAEQDDVFSLVTDGEGWPGRRSLDESKVVVIGDSFAFGYGVDATRSFSEVNPALQVKAIGAPGYSMVQGVLLMETLGHRLEGKPVIWFVCLENDLQDNLAPEMRQHRAPFVRLDDRRGGWEIVDEHVEPAKWVCSNSDVRRLFPRMCVPGPLADRAYSACDYLIGRARASCALVGARLVVVTIPHPMQLSKRGVAELAALSGSPELCDENLPDRRIAECCRRHGVPMVAGMGHLCRSDYKRREGFHWNEQGHRRIAEVLAQLYTAFRSRALDEYIPRRREQPVEYDAARLSDDVARPTTSPAAEGVGVAR